MDFMGSEFIPRRMDESKEPLVEEICQLCILLLKTEVTPTQIFFESDRLLAL